MTEIITVTSGYAYASTQETIGNGRSEIFIRNILKVQKMPQMFQAISTYFFIMRTRVAALTTLRDHTTATRLLSGVRLICLKYIRHLYEMGKSSPKVF